MSIKENIKDELLWRVQREHKQLAFRVMTNPNKRPNYDQVAEDNFLLELLQFIESI